MFTQNNNKSLNQLIWRICLKISNGSSTIVEIAANVAACTFKEGNTAILAFLQEMGISVGASAHVYVRRSDISRINKAERAAQIQSKEARIRYRQQQKESLENEIAAGTLLYGAGIDDSV